MAELGGGSVVDDNGCILKILSHQNAPSPTKIQKVEGLYPPVQSSPTQSTAGTRN
ncbi:predicted protein [Sclerotinia sclerotiorum 1980 UF-70]|uniref:Uncharacterized protein n=1 Tax=Sclerotinia sclerotiorum (strain ATCC 18683 / 1980 / Ss-1) TaxID=665079 RepID=A7E9P6_SCLS1|nr:predicted protein [Sclerotinia sclerotiorum 1980 UF-70]EDN97098.1 predicted protein [Sclerotinia sclerotiorum 1980 UF-70]